MSAATASSTDTDVVHVRLTDEPVQVWRPVSARRLTASVYQLESCVIPEDEEWEFQPGDLVQVAPAHGESGPYLRAVRLARAEPA